MMTNTESFSLPDFAELKEKIYSKDEYCVQRALHNPAPSLDDLASLLSPAADSFLGAMAARSHDVTSRRFGNTIQIYGPVYLSNYCMNRCAYCGFSAGNKIERRVLSVAEVEAEVEILRSWGLNHILLVSGEAPKLLGVEYLEDIAWRFRDKFASMSIEVQPLSTEEYSRLFNAGITSVAVYQETYDRQIYEQVHLFGLKCDYDFRLQTPDRVAAAGMREVGIGALLGLSDWRAEGLALAMHLAWLRKKYWRTSLTVSFPRLRPATGGFEPLMPVGERELSQLLFALRLFDPDVGLLLSTREEERYRDGMLGLGPTRYSAGSCTAPGGYANPELEGEQFAIGDLRSVSEVCSAVHAKGLDPVRKDWDSSFQVS